MPTFQITIVNDRFEATSDAEHADFETAAAEAQKGALEIGVEQVLTGKPFFGAEVVVAQGNTHRRFVVSVAVGPLL